MGARSSIYSAYGCCVQPDDEMEKRRGTSHVMIQVVGSASLLPLLGLPPTLRQNRFSFHYYSRATLAFVMTAFPIAEFSMLLLLAAGFYLALSAWSLGTSWIAVTLVSLLLMIALVAALIRPRMRAILMTTTPELANSIIVMVVALVLGLALGVLVSRATRTRGLEVAARTGRTRE